MSAQEPAPNMINRQDIPLTTDHGHRLSLRVFEPQSPRAVVIIAGAMGVGQHCYEKFARFLAQQGYTALTFDYFGTGASRSGPMKDCPVRITDWGSDDCQAVIRMAEERYPGLPLKWVGHSVGGQLLGMIPNVNRLQGAITIACGSGYWRQNSPPTKRIAWLLWYFLAPLSLSLTGYFPGSRLNIVGDLPPQVMRQWRRWCLNRDYAVGAEGPAMEQQFAKVTVPITSVSFTDDEMMSRRNTESLHGFFRNADTRIERIAPADIGEPAIGHLGWFRERYRESLWRRVLLPLLA